MQPIDKFDWTWEEREILQYATWTYSFCTAPNMYGLLPSIGMENVGGRGFSDRVCPFSPAIEIFTNRYNNRELTNYFSYEEYVKQDEIQELISDLELDPIKFWFLLLFAYDFAESVCINGIRVGESTHDQLKRFIDSILPHVKHFSGGYGTTFDTNIEMTIKVKGVKGSVKIDSPTALHFLAETCKNELEKYDIEEYAWLNYQELQNEATGLKDSPMIFFFANMLLKFFDSQECVRNKRRKGAKHSVKERILISRLICFTRISPNKSFLIDDELLKSYLKQYKESDFWNRTSSIYPEYLL